ncbi:hypothetical protein FACS1894170_03600 [Planctomycetales bacterium]|nr:hypothetical protein FACS1894170_03600 [Planctomycetales bacterium]
MTSTNNIAVISRRQFLAATGAVATLSLVGSTSAADDTSLPRFAVISDTHFENNRLEGSRVKVPKALKNLLSKTPKVDAIFVVGDLTDNGTPEQYEQLVATFNDKSNVPEGVAVYFMMGFGHDSNPGSDANEIIDIDGQKATAAHTNYLKFTKQPLHQYIDIKGYPFITLSEGGDRQSPYNDEVKKFLAEKLADAAQKYPGKPIFVFMHIPPLDTCYGSLKHEGWGTGVFLSILNQYPQVVVFSGHSHFPIGDPRSIHQGKFTAVNDGSATYSEVEADMLNIGVHPEKHSYVTEGLITAVLPNGNVEIERWDTYRNEEILPRWLVEAPFDGSNFTYKDRKDNTAPVFAEGAEPKVVVTETSYEVTFPQATDNEVVSRYRVEIFDGGHDVLRFSVFSQFYLNSEMPKELTVKFDKLPASELTGNELTAAVRAYDSYGNKTGRIWSKPFTAN